MPLNLNVRPIVDEKHIIPKTIEYIQRNAAAKKPFFVYVGYSEMHCADDGQSELSFSTGRPSARPHVHSRALRSRTLCDPALRSFLPPPSRSSAPHAAPPPTPGATWTPPPAPTRLAHARTRLRKSRPANLPRLAFNRIVVTPYRMYLELRGLAANTINQQLADVRHLAHEAAAAGLLSPELVAGISRVKGCKTTWLPYRELVERGRVFRNSSQRPRD